MVTDKEKTNAVRIVEKIIKIKFKSFVSLKTEVHGCESKELIQLVKEGDEQRSVYEINYLG